MITLYFILGIVKWVAIIGLALIITTWVNLEIKKEQDAKK